MIYTGFVPHIYLFLFSDKLRKWCILSCLNPHNSKSSLHNRRNMFLFCHIHDSPAINLDICGWDYTQYLVQYTTVFSLLPKAFRVYRIDAEFSSYFSSFRFCNSILLLTVHTQVVTIQPVIPLVMFLVS